MARRRNKGSGYLILRGRTWYAAWHDADGVLHRESTEFKKDDRDKALDYLNDKVAFARLSRREDRLAFAVRDLEDTSSRLDRLMEESAPKPRESGLTLGGLVEAYMSSPRRRDSSETMLRKYRQQTGAFVSWAGSDVEVDSVGDETADEYAKHLLRTLSNNTYNKHLNTLTAVWRTVCRGKPNPWADIPRKRLDTLVRKPFSDEEVDALLEATSGELRALIAIGRYTGMRLADACLLRWSSVQGDRISVRRTRKTGAPVLLPVHPRLADALASLPRRRAEVLPGLADTFRRGESAVSKMVQRAIRSIGLTTAVKAKSGVRQRVEHGFHSLRHTFVTRAIEAGVPSDVVRELVGHSTLIMTEHYTHLGDEAVLKAFMSMA